MLNGPHHRHHWILFLLPVLGFMEYNSDNSVSLGLNLSRGDPTRFRSKYVVADVSGEAWFRLHTQHYRNLRMLLTTNKFLGWVFSHVIPCTLFRPKSLGAGKQYQSVHIDSTSVSSIHCSASILKYGTMHKKGYNSLNRYCKAQVKPLD